MLTTELDLVEPREHEYPTIEELKRERKEIPEVEYLFLPRHKRDIEAGSLNFFKGIDTPGKGKRGFFIRYTGYVWRVYQSPPEDIVSPNFLIYHPENACKIVNICRVQFFHRDCQGHAEVMWNPWPRFVSLKNLTPKNAEKEAKILLRTKSLVFKLERDSGIGRKEKSTKIPLDSFRRLSLSAYCLFLEENKNDDLDLSDWQITEKIQEMSGIRIPERTFYRYLTSTFGSMKHLRSEAIQIILARDSEATKN